MLIKSEGALMITLGKQQEYGLYNLDRGDLSADPKEQFKLWWEDALDAEICDMNAFTLSTVDAEGNPDARIVLLKDFDCESFDFFTNYKSAKAQQLEQHNHAAMTFFWPIFERQVRIRGIVSRSSRLKSEEYFNKRPRGAQIGAWASMQSSVILSRAQLEKSYEEIEKRFLNQQVPCPEHWGGFCLKPDYFEFWQGQPNRLHDRFCYVLEHGAWLIKRLAP